jgi:hypothetical protein
MIFCILYLKTLLLNYEKKEKTSNSPIFLISYYVLTKSFNINFYCEKFVK